MDLFLTQFRQRQLGAGIALKRRPWNALRLDPRAVHVERHLVLLRETLERALHGGVVNGDVVFLRLLQLDALDHHLVEHLALQLIRCGHRRVLLLQAAHDKTRAVSEFTCRDDVVVHHRDDRVRYLRAARRGRGRQRLSVRHRAGQ